MPQTKTQSDKSAGDTAEPSVEVVEDRWLEHLLAQRGRNAVVATITPARAAQILECNSENRPVSQVLVDRIKNQILAGKWRFNGESIKFRVDGILADGQHRLFAIFDAVTAVDSLVVTGLERDAFPTIDTIRRNRSGADTVGLSGVKKRRFEVAAALGWLLRLERGYLPKIRLAAHRIENSDIERAYEDHPEVVEAVDQLYHLRSVAAPSLLATIYTLTTRRDPVLAERLIMTLENPSGAAVHDPLFRLRAWLLADREKPKHSDPVAVLAVMIKALNAAAAGEMVTRLTWRSQGRNPEAFPELSLGRGPRDRRP